MASSAERLVSPFWPRLSNAKAVLADSAFAGLCRNTYGLAPTLPVPLSGVHARVSFVPGGLAVAFRGSITPLDWARDFIVAQIISTKHPQLGPCHAGFLDAALSILPAVLNAVGDKPVFVTGHSLGGAIAQGVAALMVLAGKTPEKLVVFGSPRFGGHQFVNTLLPVPATLYRRGNDVVPVIPFDIPPLIRFLDARLLTEIGKAQEFPFACHAIDGYVADVTAKEKETQNVVQSFQ